MVVTLTVQATLHFGYAQFAAQELVLCKMQLAELNETHLGTCHELHKARDKNLAIAGKMTK